FSVSVSDEQSQRAPSAAHHVWDIVPLAAETSKPARMPTTRVKVAAQPAAAPDAPRSRCPSDEQRTPSLRRRAARLAGDPPAVRPTSRCAISVELPKF